MGIRLYPNTDKVENLEKLAGVPVGTTARLEALRASFKIDDMSLTFLERDQEYGRFYDAKSADSDLDNLDSFLLFGWGKVYYPELQGPDGYGHVDNVEDVRRLFEDVGIDADPELTEGVHWS